MFYYQAAAFERSQYEQYKNKESAPRLEDVTSLKHAWTD